MKIPYKHKDHWRYQEIDKFVIKDKLTVGDLVERLENLEREYQALTEFLDGKVILDDDTHIVLVENKLYRFNPKHVHPNVEGNLNRMKIENGKIVIDERKVKL